MICIVHFTINKVNVKNLINIEFFYKYTLTHILGRGSTGEVKLAYHNITHRKVAVKIFDKAEIIKSQKFQQIIS